jgi:hypothetical protein
MELKTFGQYLRDKSVSALLHQARKKTLKRILEQEMTSPVSRKKKLRKHMGTL